MAKNITVAVSEMPDWNNPDQAVRELHDFGVKTAREAIDWYWAKKRAKRIPSMTLRVIAILGLAFGGLAPLIAGLFEDNEQWPFWGYIALAIAGAAITLEKLFGFSTGWMRYVDTATTLETELLRFRMDWQELLHERCGKPIACKQAGPFVSRVGELLERVRKEISDETQIWAEEFRNNLTALHREIEKQRDELTPGGIEVDLETTLQPEDGFDLLLDGRVRRTFFGGRSVVRPVPPGHHTVEVRTTIDGTLHSTQKNVTVQAGAIVEVSLELEAE